jgi:nitroimidazol reductase NimA-like FMN-containing flavoprotein (pyridoxamine 5'-phosphate oxidase superfamily)
MFRKMRRVRQELSKEETIQIFENHSYGVLAVSGDEGYPYAVPLSYVYYEGNLFFHSAKQGHMMESIRNESKVSFCVVAQDKVVPEEFTTHYISAIAFGKANIVQDETKKREILELIAEKYSPGDMEGRDHEIKKTWAAVCVMQVEIEHMTGKAAMQIIKGK